MHTRFLSLALGGMLALSITGAAFAQDTPPPDQNQAGPPPNDRGGRGMRMDPTRQLERLTRELSLTSDQQDKIKPLLAERQQKMQALMQDQSLSPEDRRTQMRSIMEGTNNSIKANLADDQKQKFETMQQQRMRRGGPGGPPPPDGATPQPQL
jgi:Spy/CpxP family protein refolding chaperone